MKFNVSLCREYFGNIIVEAESEEEAIGKVEEYEYGDDEEFVPDKAGNQSVFNAKAILN